MKPNTPPATGVTAPLSTFRLEDNRLWQRRGLVGWWLNLTAPPRPPRGASIAEQERIRKAELTSLSILAVFAFLIALVSNSLANAATGQAVLAMTLALLACAVLNRRGLTRTAAYLVPGFFMVILALFFWQVRILTLLSFPAYDLFAIPIIVSALTADRRAPWILLVLALVVTLIDYSYAPHELLSGSGATNFDAVGYELGIYGWWGMINRDAALLFFAALFAWIGARSVDAALVRADRADEIAALEKEKKQQAEEFAAALDAFMQEIGAVFAAHRNGRQVWLKERPVHDAFAPYVYLINKELEESARAHTELWLLQQGELAQAIRIMIALVKDVQKGWLPMKTLAPAQLPNEALALRSLAASYYELLSQVARQAAQDTARRLSSGLSRHAACGTEGSQETSGTYGRDIGPIASRDARDAYAGQGPQPFLRKPGEQSVI